MYLTNEVASGHFVFFVLAARYLTFPVVIN